jgi:tetratricopeptide (TPR) repeat protein
MAFLALAIAVIPPTLRGDDRYPLRPDLSTFHWDVTTQSSEAQKYFDQGMALYYGFNHDAAIASFKEAVNLDQGFAMAWWGQAISAGPNINNAAMDSTASRNASEAVLRAVALSSGASPLEQALIGALTSRYVWPPPDDRKSLDIAYADAMRKVWHQFPDNPEAGALFADAAMNLRPWDLWTPDGRPQPGTPEIVATIEKVLEMVPDHPGACHFYIHTMEASPTPEKALPAADRLRNRIPGASHLVHMPSHIDIRVGHYDDAIKANRRASEVDSAWGLQPGFFALYRAHNLHFLAYAAMFEGRRALALKAANDMVRLIPLEVVRQYIDFLDGFPSVTTHVMVRFGMWEELVNAPKPPDDLLVTTSAWHYGRTVAFAALGKVDESAAEYAELKKSYEAIPESRLIGNNSARTVMRIGLTMAEGEMEYRKGNHDRAFSLLREAVTMDDSLRYDEPWGWMMPVRHALGALLLEQDRVEEAMAVYEKDLSLHPENGWALKGLMECHKMSGQTEKEKDLSERFRKSWARADIDIKASCYCRTGM